jgi:hypothetical protein
MAFTVDDVAWLTAHPEAVAEASELPFTASSSVRDTAALRDRHGDRARVLAELVTARRRGKVPADWLVCSDSAQQATPAVVAEIRARHIASTAPGAVVFDATCSVGSELRHLADPSLGFGLVAGGDLDAARLAMARHNLPDVPLVRADATRPAVRADVVVADPARRTARGRIRDPKDLVPPLPDLLAAWGTAGGAGAETAVKCAPGIDYSEWEGQVDVVGLAGSSGAGGGVKEACLYSPGLSRYGRRALVVGPDRTGVLTTSDPESDAVAPVGRFILDPDGAVVRAGLVTQYAAALGWWRVDPHIAYLSGDSVPDPDVAMPGQRVFEVIDTVALKKLKAALGSVSRDAVPGAGSGATSLEILVRGVDVDPDGLRKKMRPVLSRGGGGALTVVITRIGRSPVAVVARQVHPRG